MAIVILTLSWIFCIVFVFIALIILGMGGRLHNRFSRFGKSSRETGVKLAEDEVQDKSCEGKGHHAAEQVVVAHQDHIADPAHRAESRSLGEKPYQESQSNGPAHRRRQGPRP